MENNTLNKLEVCLRELLVYEKKGLDTSSLKIFIKNFKEFLKTNGNDVDLTPEEKILIIKGFLEDKKAFPTIREVIVFANDRLGLDFKDQKESRSVTISRIIGRVESSPEIKEKLKKAVISIRNEMAHVVTTKRSKKQIITADTFNKWAEIIKKI